MFEQALKAIAQLSASDRHALIARLDKYAPSATTSVTESAMIWIPFLLNTGGSDPIRRLSQPNPRYAGVPKAHVFWMMGSYNRLPYLA